MDSCLNALPTRKVLKFLSRLNEMSGGKENTVFSFGIIVENFEGFENDIFDGKVFVDHGR